MEKEYDFQKICRACLNEERTMSSVFDLTNSHENRAQMIDFFRRLTSLKLSKGDGLPENICSYCAKQVFLAYNFSQLCVSSDLKLRSQRNRAVFHNIQREIIEEETLDFNNEVEEQTINLESASVDAPAPEPCTDQESTTCSVNDNDENVVLIYEGANPVRYEELREKNEKSKPRNFECSTFREESVETRNVNEYRCVECSKSFTKKCHLSIHLRSHVKQQDRKFTCMVCGQQFTYLYLLKQHSYKHTEEKPFPCTKCSKGCLTAESLRRHMKIHDANYKKKMYVCHVCSKQFPYPSFLSEHMKNHTGERPFLCSICGKGFRQNGALDYHMRSHTGYKPFTCDVCNHKFMSQSTLNVHMRKHTNERPYVCDVCGMAFRQSTDLRSHKRTHTGDKPVLCTICGKRMSTTGQLTVHIRSHTGEKPFLCKTCPKSFATSTMLAKHKRIHTGERPYVCTICNKAFNQTSSLKTHIKTHKPGRSESRRAAKEKRDADVDVESSETFVLTMNSRSDVVRFKSAHIVYIDSEGVEEKDGAVLPAPIPLLQHL